MMQSLARPPSRANWRGTALGLAALPDKQVPSDERGACGPLRVTAWDAASDAAYWRTAQLRSLGLGRLPLVM